MFSGGHEFLIIVKEKKTGRIVKMFRFLSSRNNPGLTKEKNPQLHFKIGIGLAKIPCNFNESVPLNLLRIKE